MKLAFQLAFKNLIGSGLRTWLNVGVLSFAFVIMIFYNGLIDGWNEQAKLDSVAWEYGNGQLHEESYDPFDPFTLQDGHGILDENKSQNLTPILLRQATVYPEGRMLSVVLKGIKADQDVLNLPTAALEESDAFIPAVIGKRMAETANLEEGEEVLLRWRDKNGTFDAANITIVGIFDCNVPNVDNGQIWISIERLWELTGMENEATMFIANDEYIHEEIAGWTYSSKEDLLRELTEIIAMKKVSGSIMYGLLLAIALLAIFDTQVLSIFRRQKEIGTYIALGMTRWQVVGLFTVEGSMYSFLATIVGCIYGIPFLYYMATNGITMAANADDMGISIADVIYPVYGLELIISSIVLVVISATIVSFLPARKIAKMNPVDALKGKLS